MVTSPNGGENVPSKNPRFTVRFSTHDYKERFEEMAREKGLTLNEFLIGYSFQGYMAEKLGKMSVYQKGKCPYVPGSEDGADE